MDTPRETREWGGEKNLIPENQRALRRDKMARKREAPEEFGGKKNLRNCGKGIRERGGGV